jgi:hypothetical protein
MNTMSASAIGPNATELGQMLFQRRQNPMAVFWIVISVLFGGIGVAAFVGGAGNPKSGGTSAGFLFTGVAAAIALYVAIRSRRVLRCYELGVSVTGWLGQRSLRFDHVAVLTFSATKMRAEGIPIGTTFRIRLEPERGSDSRPITFSGALRKHDDQIETLRELASQSIANRMGRQLVTTGRAAWTRHLALVAQGIEYRPLGFLARKPAIVLPYEEISNVHIGDGFFTVQRQGRKRPVIRANVSEPNFFPGYRLLVTVFEQKRKLAAAGE